MGWASGEMVWPMEQKIPGISKFPGKGTTGCQYIWFCTGNLGWNRSRSLNLVYTPGSNFDLSIETMVPWRSSQKGHEETPRTNLSVPVDNWPLFPPCKGAFVTQRAVRTFNVSMAFWPRVFRNFRSEPTWKKIFLANVIRLQSSRKCTGRIGIHLYFASMKELGHQRWFQRIYSVSCFGHGWNTVWPFVTLNSRNPNDANSPKSLRIGLKSW